MTENAANTGSGPMTMVAIDQLYPKDQRIVEDDLAYRFLSFGNRAYVWLMRPSWARDWMIKATEKSLPGIWGGILCRKRYIDDKVAEAADAQLEAVVNLGAGFDTRAYRHPALTNVPVWEVDQPENVEAKRSRLRQVFGEVPDRVTLVSLDLDRADLGGVLASHDYTPGKRTFFIWEAVTQYLTEEGIRTTMKFMANAPAGSRLAFTYVRKDFVIGENLYGQEDLYKEMILKDQVWLFGINPEDVADFLGEYGWRVLEHLGYEELTAQYVKPTGRQLEFTPVERMVYAEKR